MNEPRSYRGIQRGSVPVQTHPDWRAQLLLEQVREAESEQALDRLRLLRGEGKDRQVYILSNVPLNVTVDYGWSWTEYQQLLSLWEEADGLMPLNPEHLMKRCPVNSKGVTRTKELIQGWKRSEILIVNTIRKSDLYVREYRPVDSSSRWSSVVSEAKVTPEVAKTALEAQWALLKQFEFKTAEGDHLPWADLYYHQSHIGRMLRGGRFYAHFCTYPKKERLGITISGEPVGSLDLSQIHPTLLLAMEGLQSEAEVMGKDAPEDAYSMPEYEEFTRSHKSLCIFQVAVSPCTAAYKRNILCKRRPGKKVNAPAINKPPR